MATPTPSKHPTSVPSAGAIAATPPVSTPFSTPFSASKPSPHPAGTAFSPPSGGGGTGHSHSQRSVGPSPQHFKKSSPANSNIIYGHPSNSSLGAMNFDSPNTAAALGWGLGAGVGGLDLDSHGGLMLTGGAGGMGFGVGLAGLRADEDDKRKRLGLVVDVLKGNKGRVSEEGIERLARRVGLECLWEDQIGSGGSIKRLVVAGTGLLIEFDFANNAVLTASVSFPESSEIVMKHSSTAAEVLLQDLQLQPLESALTKMLDKFAVNLERLAALDKLSVMPQLNCHEAISGIYESLRRLYEWEVSRLIEEEEMKGGSQTNIIRTAICSRSGRPRMNARGNVGLSLDYWQERHFRRKRSKNSISRAKDTHEPKTWSLIVECAPSLSPTYQSVRSSEKWISSDIQKANPIEELLIMETGGAVLDWQDPESIMIPSADAPKDENAMEGIEQDLNISNSKYPDVMFIAKFHPPLVVPLLVAAQTYASVGTNLGHYSTVNMDALLFPPQSDEQPEPDATYRRIQREQTFNYQFEPGLATMKTYKNTLSFQKPEFGHVLTELPFDHPRQLVNLLPLLRQYAFLSSLVDRGFGSEATEVKAEENEISGLKTTIREEYDAFLSEVLSHDTQLSHAANLPIDVTLHTQPRPTLKLTFPFRNRTADIRFDIGMNGSATVGYESLLDDHDGAGKGKALKREDLAKMLEASEDLAVFVELARRRLQ